MIYYESKMNPIFKKFNYKNQSEVIVLSPPESLNSDLNKTSELANVKTLLRGVKEIEFILIFVTKKIEIDSMILQINNLLNEDLDKTFYHPEAEQKVSLRENIEIYTWHCKHHLEHIRQTKLCEIQ